MPNRRERRAAKLALRPKGRVPFEPLPVLPSWKRRLFLVVFRWRIKFRLSVKDLFSRKSVALHRIAWLPRVAGIGLIIAGLALMTPAFYWYSVGISYFGFAACLVEFSVEPVLRDKPLLRNMALLFVLALTVFFSYKFVFVKAPIDFDAYAMRNGEYSQGTIINGIKWDPHFTDLRVWIKNPTDDDYENVYLNLQPDQWNHTAAIVGDSDGCHLISLGGNNVSVIPGLKGVPKHFVTHHEQHNFEYSDDAGDIAKPLARQGGYRLECTKLAARDSIQIVIALVALDVNDERQSAINSSKLKAPGDWISSFTPSGDGPPDKNVLSLLGPRPSTRVVRIDGHYNLGPKRFSIEKRVINVGDGN